MIVKMPYTVLSLQPQASKIIQAYSSNKSDAPGLGFVDIKGRVIAMAEHCPLSEQRSLLAVHSCCADALMSHLRKYLPLFDADIERLPLQVFHDTDSTAESEAEHEIPYKPGRLLLTHKEMESLPFDDVRYTLFRQELRLPIHGEDFTDTMILNVGPCERYISYEKGCYLGQEIIARVHYKGKAPLCLDVISEDSEPLNLTSPVSDPESGKRRGFLLTPNSSS
ncbi:MAG: hypothetical protein KC649_01545 [Candidatus Omnitrophica bacterium]|nr:hypothetical protein [Candidatus Omnitrophota bacterium]